MYFLIMEENNIFEETDIETLLDIVIEDGINNANEIINNPNATPEEKERAKAIKECLKDKCLVCEHCEKCREEYK